MNYIAHVPLAGGFALGNMNIIGKPPVAITSYTPFDANDTLLVRYLDSKDLGVPYYQLDKEMPDFEHLFGKIDFVTAVPPCSALSQAAQRKAGTRGTCEVNDWMYKSAHDILGKMKPTVYAFENAPGLFTNMGEEVRRRLIEIGKMYGYSITFYKTNTLRHGIPQFRPRTFGIFYKGPNAVMLHYYNKQAPLLSEYLKQIPKKATLQTVYNNSETDISKWEITKYLKHLHGDKWKEALSKYRSHLVSYDYLRRVNLLDDFLKFQKSLPDRSEIVTRNLEHVIKNSAEGRNTRTGYRILGVDQEYVYAVIGEMMARQVHPTEERLINIREFMHLMGLPHDYELESPKEYVKITQNVPVCTCEDITREIVEIIKGNRELYKDSVYMQDNTKEEVSNKSKKLF